MFLRWIHNAWRYFWTIILVLLIIVVLGAGGILGVLQLEQTKDYIAERIEANFNSRYDGTLEIGKMEGFIPFKFQFDNLELITSERLGEGRRDTVIKIKRMEADIEVWSLLQNTLSIRRFKVESPEVRLLQEGQAGYSLKRVFTKTAAGKMMPADSVNEFIQNIEILAPDVSIQNGKLIVDRHSLNREYLQLPETLRINSINTSLFLEISEFQRILNFENLSLHIDGMKPSDLRLSGQIFNDNKFLEFNAFNLSTPRSELKINGEIEGINIYRNDISSQFLDAFYNLDVESDYFHLDEFSNTLTSLPNINEAIEFGIHTEGSLDSLILEEFSFGIGESYFTINGYLNQLKKMEDLSYNFKIEDMAVSKQDVEIFAGNLEQKQYDLLEKLELDGDAKGTVDSVHVDLNLASLLGDISVNAELQLTPPYSYNGSLTGSGIDLSAWLSTKIDTTNLNFDVTVNGLGYQLDNAVFDVTASVYNSSFNDVEIENIEFEASMIDGFLENQYTYQFGDEIIQGSGWIDFQQESLPFSLQGNAQNLNIARYFSSSTRVPETQLFMDYNVEIRGLNPDQIYGRANLDINRSIINGDSVRAHQFYMDLDSPDLETRTLRLTSSMFDLNISGDIKPIDIIANTKFWNRYLTGQIDREILFKRRKQVSATDSLHAVVKDSEKPNPVSLTGTLEAKDLELIRNYWPSFPKINSDLGLQFELNMDQDKLLANVDIRGDSLHYNNIYTLEPDARLTASFRSNTTLKEFSNFDFETTASRVESDFTDLDSLRFDFSLRNDSVTYTQQIGSFSGNAESELNVRARLSDESWKVNILHFYVGNENYAWRNTGIPEIEYTSNNKVIFQDFRFQNLNEYVALRGVLSSDRSDSLSYIIRDVNLERISGLIKGRVNFGGKVNGSLITRSLTESPSIQGALNVNRLTIEDRLIGDATFNSRFNRGKDRFDTRISIVTDSTKYDEYLSGNNDIGQRIFLDGYFVPPRQDTAQDTVYHFDINFEEIDLWVLEHIAHKAFENVEGIAFGNGYFTGNMEEYDFHSEFQVDSAYIKPQFLNTNYFANGKVTFDRQDWIVIDSLDIRDNRGGTGKLYGSIDLMDFRPISDFDLNLSMDRLNIINNEFDPDVPFYGSISGTGILRLSGLNTNLFLQTAGPIRVTPDSRLSIPLLEETELNESRRFIQFVEEFDSQIHKKPIAANILNGEEEAERETINRMIENLTFSERFNLDLSFNAPDPMTVELIFDPVTGEVVQATGTGQLRLTMEEEDVQMFGRYNIEGGSYQFVGGDIITRRLQLEQGGTIVWEGDPDNARLDISAIYNARPSLSSLTAVSTGGATGDQEINQRVNVELVVEITGTLSSVENNYYFRLPNTLDIASNTALAARINDINRNDEEKLFQATSILMTGQFINVSNSNEASTALTQNLSRGSTFVNPILSSQVISPLLSNQINALLNSDVSRFDIDFNLNAYNEIDLGVALRLYNDKIVLRREGQITGGRTETSIGERIGDLNATYRINRGLSITAFHRQDQSLSSVTPSPQAGDVNATVDGIGLEARIQFNRWSNFTRKLGKTFAGIFGSGKKQEEDENDQNIAKDGTESSNENMNQKK